MNDTLIGIILTAVLAPSLLKLLEWGIARTRQHAETRQINQATDRDDLRFALDEWRAIFDARLLEAQQRHANQLERWLNRAAGCAGTDPECQELLSEVEAEIVRLRFEGP